MLLDIMLYMQGETEALTAINRLAKEAPEATMRGLIHSGREIADLAIKNLTGPGRTAARLRDARRYTYSEGNINRRTIKATRARGQHSFLGARPGSYPPVPSITGHLRGSLSLLEPGERKGSISAAKHEVIILNSAAYADVVHDGRGSSRKYGKRPFFSDAIKTYGFDRIVRNIEEEIASENL